MLYMVSLCAPLVSGKRVHSSTGQSHNNPHIIVCISALKAGRSLVLGKASHVVKVISEYTWPPMDTSVSRRCLHILDLEYRTKVRPAVPLTESSILS